MYRWLDFTNFFGWLVLSIFLQERKISCVLIEFLINVFLCNELSQKTRFQFVPIAALCLYRYSVKICFLKILSVCISFSSILQKKKKNQQYLALVGALGGAFNGAFVGALGGAIIGAFVEAFIGAFVVAFIGAIIGAIIGAGDEERVSSTDRFTMPPFTVKTKQRVHLQMV